jgi:hypothetical protein
LMIAAIFTKQVCVPLVLWLLAFRFFTDRRSGVMLALTTLGVSVVVLLLLIWRTHGHYWYYTFAQLKTHGIMPVLVLVGLVGLVKFVPYLLLFPVQLAILLRRRNWSRRTLLWSGLLLIALPTSLLSFAKPGGFNNNLMPVCVLAGPVTLCALSDLLRTPTDRARISKPWLLVTAGVCAVYLQLWRYRTADYRVDEERRAGALALNRYIKRLDGSVLIPSHPFLAIRNGQRTEQIHAMSWYDMTYTRASLIDFEPFLRKIQPKYVMLTGGEWGVLTGPILRHYTMLDLLPPETHAAGTILPEPSFPDRILQRREPITSPSSPGK